VLSVVMHAQTDPNHAHTLESGVLLLSRMTNSSTVLRRLGSGANSLRFTWWWWARVHVVHGLRCMDQVSKLSW